jgi:uncharacterized glyoxalase superfamily protein PhnB
MKLNAIVPMLTVPDVEAAVEFYCTRLGFTCLNRMEAWACVGKDGVELMFAAPNAHLPFDKPQFTGSLYFRCDDVDELWAKLKDQVEVVYPIENFAHGMREFAIRDHNGYLLQFGQEMQE